jgi:hypothetical protein
MHACKCGRWLESAQSEECAIHEANSLVLAWPVCFTGLSPRFFALLSSIIPCRACHLVHPSSPAFGRRKQTSPPVVQPSSGAKPCFQPSTPPPPAVRPVGIALCPQSGILFCSAVSSFKLFPGLNLQSFHTHIPNTNPFAPSRVMALHRLSSFLLSCPKHHSNLRPCIVCVENGLRIVKWAATCITSYMIRGRTPAPTTLHKQVERTP